MWFLEIREIVVYVTGLYDSYTQACCGGHRYYSVGILERNNLIQSVHSIPKQKSVYIVEEFPLYTYTKLQFVYF